MKHKRSTEVSSNWGQFAASQVFTHPEQVLAGLFGSSTVGLAINDRQLRFQAINNTLATINGIPAEAHLGKTLREVLGSAAAKIEPALKHVLITGEALLDFEISAQLPTRSEVGHWIVNYLPIRDSTGRVVQVGALVIEVTKERKLEKSLRSLTGTLFCLRASDQRRIVRELHNRLSQPNLGIDERADQLTQTIELMKRCILEAHAATQSDLRYEIFKVIPDSSYVKRVGSADGLEKAEDLLNRLASKHDADYFVRDKRTGAIIARTNLLLTKSKSSGY